MNMKNFLTFGLLALLSLVAACASAPKALTPTAAAAASATVVAQAGADYEIGPEDVLEISVWKEEGLKKEVLVRADGGISFPLVGEVMAAGKTAAQLQQELTQRLTKFIPRPSVSVALLKISSYKIYVMGRVNKPGELTLGRRVDVLQALSLAGGLTPFANAREIKILRRSNGKTDVYPFDYALAQRGADLSRNILLKSGDTVVVP